MENWESTTAGDDDPAAIYAQLAGLGDTGADASAQQRPGKKDPSRSPIHAVGSNVATIAAAALATLTATPVGVAIRADSIELSDVACAGLLVTGILIGGLPIIHGGTVPGDMFRSTAVQKLRPAVPLTSNNGLVMSVTSIATASLASVCLGVKGPIQPNRT